MQFCLNGPTHDRPGLRRLTLRPTRLHGQAPINVPKSSFVCLSPHMSHQDCANHLKAFRFTQSVNLICANRLYSSADFCVGSFHLFFFLISFNLLIQCIWLSCIVLLNFCLIILCTKVTILYCLQISRNKDLSNFKHPKTYPHKYGM